MLEPKNIIVKMPNWLGDVVMGTPVLADLRQNFPNTRITAMCQANVGQIIKEDPNIDELLVYQRPSGWVYRVQHWDLIDQLQRGQYDVGILLTNSFSSAWWFWRGKVQRRIGFKGNLRSWLLTEPLDYPQNVETQHQVDTYKALLSPLGIKLSKNKPTLYLTPEEKEAANKLLERYNIQPGKNKIIGINPGAAYGSAKCWLPERFTELTTRLLEDPTTYVLYFGDKAGAPLVNEICKNLPPERVINLAGRTSIRELMALINACSVLLTNDSGPMHIGAALNVPLLALFGSTSDVKTGPSYGTSQVIHKHVSCSPCYKRVCPIDFRCMKQISVEEVYTAIQQMHAKYKK